LSRQHLSHASDQPGVTAPTATHICDRDNESYRVGYATSTSVDGPWTYRGVILQKDASQGILDTGHSSIVQVSGTEESYIAPRPGLWPRRSPA
jgi:hypothetical protein